MAQTIAEYYAIDYPKCQIDDSFLASWKGLAFPSRVFQFVAIPTQLLTGYLILNKTPVAMKSVKFPLLVFHIACSLQDFTLNTLVTPYVFLPSYAFFGVGLLNWLGFSWPVQGTLMLSSIYCSAAAMMFLFESRSSLISTNKFKMTKASTRSVYYLANILFNSAVTLSFVFHVPQDQEVAKLEVLSYIPCPTREFFTENTYVVLDSYWANIMIIYVVPLLLGIVFAQVMFFVSISIYLLYCVSIHSSNSSKSTQRQLRNFFIGIIFQTLIPIIIMAIPYTVISIIMTKNQLTQGLTNLYFTVFGLHGLMESIAIIIVHKPYRKAFLEFFRLDKPVSAVTAFEKC